MKKTASEILKEDRELQEIDELLTDLDNFDRLNNVEKKRIFHAYDARLTQLGIKLEGMRVKYLKPRFGGEEAAVVHKKCNGCEDHQTLAMWYAVDYRRNQFHYTCVDCGHADVVEFNLMDKITILNLAEERKNRKITA